jgi:hypothetical protein
MMDGLPIVDYMYLDSFDSKEAAEEARDSEFKLFSCVIVHEHADWDLYAVAE